MKVKVWHDVDGTEVKVIKGHRVSTQLFRRGGTAIVLVYNKKGKVKKCYHFGKVYLIEKKF